MVGVVLIFLFYKDYKDYFIFFEKSFFDWLDFALSIIIMFLGGMVIFIFMGWVLKKEKLCFLSVYFLGFKLFVIWYFLFKYIIFLIVFFIWLSKIY